MMPLSVAVHNRALGSAGERLVLYSRAMSRDEILARLREFEPALRERGIAHAALFGSAARGDNGPESDIDIMVEFAPEARVTRRRSRLCIRRPLRRRLLCGLSERSRHESNEQIPCLRLRHRVRQRIEFASRVSLEIRCALEAFNLCLVRPLQT
jgi:hypothetical protein